MNPVHFCPLFYFPYSIFALEISLKTIFNHKKMRMRNRIKENKNSREENTQHVILNEQI